MPSNLPKPQRHADTAPADSVANARYSALLKDAEKHGLIVQAYGGVATIAIPSEQRKAGIRDRVLAAACLNETAVRDGV